MSQEPKSPREIVIINKTEGKRDSGFERISKTASIAAIPIVLAVAGWFIQERLQSRTVARDYVQLAVTVLNGPAPSNKELPLRAWAVDLLNENSPTKFSPEVVQRLKSGESRLDDLDPLGIAGTWTYTTDLKGNAHDGLEAFRGTNTIIAPDRNGYRMTGERTHFRREHSENFELYPSPKKIEFSRVSYSLEEDKFYFYFNVIGEGRSGFVDMKVSGPGKSNMKGEIHYLQPNGTWSRADIRFEKHQ